jgi:hypothetical protein
MPATAFAAISPFEQVAGGEYPIAFRTPVVISFFQRDSLVHEQMLCLFSATKIGKGSQIRRKCKIGVPRPFVCGISLLTEKSGD